MIESLDHVAVVSAHPEMLFGTYERLGFHLTPLSMHHGAVNAGEDPIPWGTGNRCAMLRSGYLELLAIIDPTRYCGIFPSLLERYAGLHIIAFGCQDALAEEKRLIDTGVATDGVVTLQRDLETDDGMKRARFSLLRPARSEAAEGRINFIQHHTPDYLWQPSLLDHPNRAVALREVVVCVDDPGEAAERYGRILGISPVRTGRAQQLDMAQGSLVLVSPGDLPTTVPADVPPFVPFIAAFSVATDAPDVTRRHLETGEIPFERENGNLVVPAGEACGTILVFEPV